ncbi:EAL domain-containing protein [Azospirillum picis]|uniref:EAL domain-containing protein (Putative c-di-GMP-specific phosphodiesterase class I) n=1 Tax=Azospirillum picis TaxID=488438 RepID=A0ABU0MJF3_9PROT|nr:EAL domain-containing protein [Azospirillum picis]MBP2299455.1 EAL domain-containing protein (putative c-di-GMP-specific phosphodiesterase class I) [Azospirillum picis]MDQ0533418.1 EAL domain-containing protein (putative c-di-GMP-specific phosphodiesterase class I) [Azospirillum picis]
MSASGLFPPDPDGAGDGFAERVRDAIDRQELFLVYQPQADVFTNRLTGFEALSRWRLSDGTMLPPDVFVPMAEQGKAIHLLGEWSLRTACAAAAEWQRTGMADVPVSVNLSARQLDDPGLVRMVLGVLADSGLPAANLKLELTETALFGQTQNAREALVQLRGAGVRLVLDDFGTGWSSLATLRRVPVESLKIDKQFVQAMVEDRDAAAIVQAVVAMAHALDLTAVAEGVETPEQRLFLQAYRCDTLQGFWLSRPLPTDGVPDFLSRLGLTATVPGSRAPGAEVKGAATPKAG